MSAPTRVASGLYRLDTKVTGTDMPLAVYLLAGHDWLVTDTGCVGMMRDLAQPGAASLRPGSRIGRAVVSHAHADHFGGNAELLASNPSCRIFVHEADADWAREPAWHVRDAYDALGRDYPCPQEVADWVSGLLGAPAPVETVASGDTLGFGDGRTLRVVHLPGHSPGHIGLWEPEERILLLGDAILGAGQRIDGHVVAVPAYLDVNAYLATIRAVRALEPAIACPAHFPVMDGERILAFCDESDAFVRRLDEAVRSAMRDGRPRTLRELTAITVPIVAPEADISMVAGLSVQAHLDDLARHGLARWVMRGDERAWTGP